MATNPTFIDTANVNYFGFNTTFNPFEKTILFDIAGITTFKTGGEANITSISFVVTDPNATTYGAVVINPSLSQTEVTLSGLEQGVLYFGQYHIVGTLTEPATSDEDEQEYTIEFDVNVCYDTKLNNKNLAVGCVLIDVNCSTAKMSIKEGVNLKFAGKVVDHISTLGTVNYPIDPETLSPFLDPVQFEYTPYSLSLANSITGTYSITLITTAYYDLGNQCLLAIQYRSNVDKKVLCGNGMCEITCCWTESIEVIKAGGSRGSQMAELVAQAVPYYISASLLADCGKNNEKYVKKVKEILNCDCKCDSKSLLIQPNPITFGASNLIGTCGTTITEDENGDYVFHSFAYRIQPSEDEDKISFETVQINECTKVTYATIHCDKIEQCIYNILATDPDILLQWQTLLGINTCPCSDVDISNTPTLVQVNKINSDFDTLDDSYFVKSDVITGVVYNDNTSVVGGTASYVKYTDQIIQQNGLVPVIGGNITLPCGICGGSLAEKSGYSLITETHTTCGCSEVTECELATPKVDYSERYGYAYRANFQMGDLSSYTIENKMSGNDVIQVTTIYFNDTNFIDGGNSNAGFVRKMVLETNLTTNITTLIETRTISGRESASTTPSTYTNSWGNNVEYFFNSSVNIDESEIVNGEPVLYFVTFGGVICRLVKERNTECDERANWKTYVIGGINIPLVGEGAFSLSAGSTAYANSYTLGCNFYGMKKFLVDENGNQTFLFADTTSTKVFLLYYVGTGSKNDANNWRIGNPNILAQGVDLNINVELGVLGSDGDMEGLIWSFGNNFIQLTRYSGSNAIADIIDNTLYITSDVCVNASAGATSYIDGTGNLATISSPLCLFKFDDKYYFSNRISFSPTSPSYLRYFTKEHEADEPDSYTFATEIVVNSESYLGDGTYVAGVTTNASGATQGALEIPNVGIVSVFINGLKIFDFDNEEIVILSGQAVANGDLQTGNFMDTQYAYELSNCGSDE